MLFRMNSRKAFGTRGYKERFVMKLRLKNIGIIEEADINLPGLTVITGKNSSGKSTVGKALYAVIDGAIDITEKYNNDISHMISVVLMSVSSLLSELSMIVRISSRDSEEESLRIKQLFSEYIKIWELLNMGPSTTRVIASEAEVEELAQEFEKFDVVDIIDGINKIRSKYKQPDIGVSDKHEIRERVSEAGRRVDKLMNQLNATPDYKAYAASNINDTLHKEFVNQIQPVKWDADYSDITISNDRQDIVDIRIDNNNVIALDIANPDNYFDRAIMIDDPMIIDQIDGSISQTSYLGRNVYIPGMEPSDHRESLLRLIRNTKQRTVLEKTQISKEAQEIEWKLDSMLSGDFSFEDEGSYIIGKDGKKLRLSNMATGTKTVAILIMLIREGLLTQKSVLIFDEPESHLHPEWQNIFAEIIVLIEKVIGAHIVLTTHSPNFFYALDTYSRKYDIISRCAFYQAESADNGHVKINDVSKDVGKIYSDFLNYLLDMKAIREKLRTD